MITKLVFPQGKLSSECWLVQTEGLDACKHCSVRGTSECGGKRIRKTGKNALGHKVPLGHRFPIGKVE
jgi:hypothetical protein